jgi:heme/copper-type cytochrome/quinol oxidase subunit 2
LIAPNKIVLLVLYGKTTGTYSLKVDYTSRIDTDVNDDDSSSGLSQNTLIIIIAAGGGGVLLIIVGIIVFCVWRRRKNRNRGVDETAINPTKQD